MTARIRVLADETTIRAGQSVHVSAVTSGKGKQSDVGVGSAITAKFEWNFGDTTDTAKYNDLPGFNAAHVYDTPGTYRIRLQVTNEAGESDTNARIITVLPNSLRNIYVSRTGNDNNDGTNKNKPIATIGRAMQLLGDNTKLQFHRGETFKIAYSLRLYFKNVVVGAYGPGKPPILQIPRGDASSSPNVFTMGKSTHQVTIQGLTIDSLAPGRKGDAIRSDGTNIVVRDCTFRNFDCALMNNRSPVGLLAEDNLAGTLGGNFVWDNGSDHVYLGNTCGDSERAHNYRFYASRILAYRNDMTNKPVGSSIYGLRVNEGSYIYWSQNVLHGAPMMIGPIGPTNDPNAYKNKVSNVVVEDNQILAVKKMALPHDRIQVNPGASNVMIRNNVIVANNSTAIAAHTYSSARWPGQRKNTKRYLQNLVVLNNTATDGGTHGSFLAVYDKTPGAITLKNNLYVAPKLIVGPFSTSAIRVLGRGDLGNFTPLSGGGGIDGNVWPDPNRAEDIGAMYISRHAPHAYVKPSQWLTAFADVVGHNDRFDALASSAVLPNGSPSVPLSVVDNARPVRGVFADMDGNPRPTTHGAKWTAGAVELVDATLVADAASSSTAG